MFTNINDKSCLLPLETKKKQAPHFIVMNTFNVNFD